MLTFWEIKENHCMLRNVGFDYVERIQSIFFLFAWKITALPVKRFCNKFDLKQQVHLSCSRSANNNQVDLDRNWKFWLTYNEFAYKKTKNDCKLRDTFQKTGQFAIADTRTRRKNTAYCITRSTCTWKYARWIDNIS